MSIEQREQPRYVLVIAKELDLPYEPLVRLALDLRGLDDLQGHGRCAPGPGRPPDGGVATVPKTFM